MGGPFLSDQERKEIALNNAPQRTQPTQMVRGGQRTQAQKDKTARLRAAAEARWGDGSDEQNRAFVDSVWYNKAASGGSGSRIKVDANGQPTGDYETFGPNPPGGGGPRPQPTPTPTNPGGNPTRGGGGGGYSGMDPAKWKQYQDAILAMVGQVQPANVGAAPEDLLSGLINTGVDSSKADSAAAYGGVADLTANAYNNMQMMDAPQFDPQIAALLEAQGMGTDYAQAAQMMAQGGLNDVAGLFGQQRNQMAATTDQYNLSRNADVDELAAHSGSQMEAQRVALLAQAAQQHQARTAQHETAALQAAYAAEQQKRELLLNLLGSGLGSGADMSGIDIAKLLGGA